MSKLIYIIVSEKRLDENEKVLFDWLNRSIEEIDSDLKQRKVCASFSVHGLTLTVFIVAPRSFLEEFPMMESYVKTEPYDLVSSEDNTKFPEYKEENYGIKMWSDKRVKFCII